MSTFNAGAIEATLTLDRSPFQRELKAAQAQAQRFSNKKITPKLELKGLDDVMKMAAALEGLDSKDINISTKIDGEGELALLDEMVSRLDGKDIDLPIKIHGEEKLIALEGIIKAMDGQDIDIGVGGGASEGIHSAVSGFSRMQAIVTAVLVLLPLVAPVVATLTAAIVGLAAGLTAAAGALGIVGLAIFPTVNNMMQLNTEIQKQQVRLASLTPGTEAYRKQQEKISNLQKEMNTRFGEASTGLKYMQDRWHEFTKATEPVAQGLVGQGMRLIGDAIKAFIPVFNAAAPVIKGVLTSMSTFINGPEGQRMIDFFTKFGSESLTSILSIGGNLLAFLGRLFEAFAPFGGSLLQSIDDVTASWASWVDGLAGSKGFQDFIAYVNVEGPKVWDLIKNIIDAFINLGVALAPLGSISLDAFNAIFSWIADMDPTILGAIVTGLGFAAVAILAVTAAMAAFNAVMALNPVVLIVIAIIALVAALIYLWNTNEGFREAVTNAWNAVWAVVETVINWLADNVLPVFETIWNGIVAGVQWLVDTFGPIISLIVQIFQQGFQDLMAFIGPAIAAIVFIVTNAFNGMMIVIRTIWPIIVAVVTGAFNVIKAVVTTVMNIISAVWSGIWNAIKIVFTTVINVIKGVLTAVLALMKGDVSGAMNAIKGVFSTVWSAIKAIVSNAINTTKAVFSAGVNGMKSIASSVWNAIVGVIRAALNTAKGVVSGAISTIKGFFSGAGGWLLGAGRSIIQGLINGISGMIGAVKNAVGNVLSAARNLLPFSPAKEGPFSGKGWTLYSGRSIVSALAQGMKDETPGLRSAALDAVAAAQNALQINGNLNMAQRVPSLAGVGGGREVNVRVTAYNPLPERSSTTAIREVTRLGQLGVFSG